MKKYSRKITRVYSFFVVSFWLLWFLLEFFAIIFVLQDTFRDLNMLILAGSLLCCGSFGLGAALLGRIPLEMGLWTLFSLPLLYISFGATEEYVPVFIGFALLASGGVNLWYLIPFTRERSGRFA